MALLDHPTIGSPVDRSAAAHPLLAEPGRPHVPVAVGPGWLPHPAAFRIGPEPSMKYPLQHTKVQRPPLREQTLHRERLLEWLASHIDRQIVLVVAKAGYGKTTLLSDFSRRTRVRTLWYRLDEDDRDWVSFLHYLVAAGREADPTFAPETARLLDDVEGGATRQEMLETFYREMRSLADVPTALIFDDYHLAHDVPDIRAIVHDLVLRAPDGLTLVFLTRRMPMLPMARLRTLGQVAELDGDDLLFDRAETEQLFRETYRRPLEPDVLADLHDRTEGWAASLEMVHAALRNRAPTDIRRFVHELSGEQDELYDYFAEEVVGGLDEEMQSFLMRTSLLQFIEPEIAEVAAGKTPSRPPELIVGAATAGLLKRDGDGRADIYRYHPLLRSFLQARLRSQIGKGGVVELHAAIARYGERRQSDWPIAAYHYAAAGRISDLHRVLAMSTPAIVAAGDLALAESYVRRYPPGDANPWFDLLMSRLELRAGHPDLARARTDAALGGFGGLDSEPDNEGANLALANLMAIELTTGALDACESTARALLARRPEPSLAAIADSTLAVLDAAACGDLDQARLTLSDAAALQAAIGQRHYYGVTMLNLAYIDRARGAAKDVLRESSEAVSSLGGSSRGPELISARLARAWALAHLGRWEESQQEMTAALDEPNPLTRAEAMSEAAEIHVYYGNTRLAGDLLRVVPDRADPSYRHWLLISAGFAIRCRRYDRATALLSEMATRRAFEPGGTTRFLVLQAQLACESRTTDAVARLEIALASARAQHSAYWTRVLELYQAALGPADEFRSAVASALAQEPVMVSVAAEAVVGRLGDLDGSGLECLLGEVASRPERWREPLRRALQDLDDEARLAASRLLEQIGAVEDVARLRAVARTLKGRRKDPALGRRLARHLAARVFVEDQGPVSLRIGTSVVLGGQIRRKVLSLLCFLLTRPDLAATRDQVLDALWPDLPPADAINSLNQTVYFLRRVFEQPFVEDLSAGYVHTVADLVQLDQELIDSRSRQCLALLKSMNRASQPDKVDDLSRLYRGRFALDFSYEEWAAAYRDSMHARFLEVIERSIGEDMAAGHFDRAIGIARRAMDADPDADHLELALVRLYRRTGAHAAAAEQYAHYASVLKNDLGVEPPPLESL